MVGVRCFESCRFGLLDGIESDLDILRQHGINVNLHNRYGETGLIVALKQNTASASFLLKQVDIDVVFKDSFHQSALHWAAQDDQNSECLATILARTSLVNPKNKGGRTALWLAVDNNAVRCVQVLISDKRTDPNIKDDLSGNSPLMLAVKKNYVDCVGLLVADPRVDLMTRDSYKRSGREVQR